MEIGGDRRHLSLPDEKLYSENYRDLQRIKEEDFRRHALAGLTLNAVLGTETTRSTPQVNRTLLDIIRDDPFCGKESKKSWRSFREKLRLRRAGATWTSLIPIPVSDIPIRKSNRMIPQRNSGRSNFNPDNQTSDPIHLERFPSSSSMGDGQNRPELNSMPSNRAMMLRRNSSRLPSLSSNRYGRGVDGSMSFNNTSETGATQKDQEEEEGKGETEESTEGEGAEEGGVPPVRMSLMALLAETDREMGLDGATYMMDDEEEEDEEEEDSGGGEYNNCCVCMVRHKGSAFIPCGHTFCRLCSRELWVQRGNCPLCNGFILEILDIF